MRGHLPTPDLLAGHLGSGVWPRGLDGNHKVYIPRKKASDSHIVKAGWRSGVC